MRRDFGSGKASPCESQLINKVIKIRIAAQRRTLNGLYIEIGHQKEILSIHERGKLKLVDSTLSSYPHRVSHKGHLLKRASQCNGELKPSPLHQRQCS